MHDLLASFVVFLVALPLCMGIAIACGVSPAVGIVTGIIGGMVVGFLGGCPLQVSGPAAGLVVILTDILHQHGPEKLGAIVLVAGTLQMVGGLFGLAHWFRAVTPAIINGMLAGIGALLFAGQFHLMVDDTSKGSGINNLLSIPGAIIKAVSPDATKSHEEAAFLGVATILIILFWTRFAPKKLKVVPSFLVAIAIVSTIAAVFHFPVRYVDLPANIFSCLQFPDANTLIYLMDKNVILSGCEVAFIASAETLLTAAALDKLHRGQRTNYDRELTGQGVGNFVCGILGVLPMTGVMVRSGVNVAAGARTRMSNIMHGVWLLLFVSFLPFVLKLIPVSSLAALLVFTGYKLMDVKTIKNLSKFGKSEVIIYATTVILIVSVDLLTGVLAGVALSICKLVYTFTRLDMKVSYDEKTNRTQLHLTGAATFLNMPKLADCLEKIRQDTELHVHLEALDYIDHACLDLLMNLDKQMKLSGGSLVIDWSTLGTVFRDRRKTYREGSVKEFRTATESNNSDTQTLQPDPSTNQSGSPNNDSEKSQSAQTEVVNIK
ncbi:MAG: SulP family inorganic anion transporter [Cyanobacteria bacterium SZAS LIN-5]|nr:SulP family inorganic anion transporter [Cyanobacteria bacterium SZAS LIN-5]RTL40398.1 MAG: SulP family inorganic anion transporter [Candidatus Melainabacteria bacterium]